MVDGSVAQFVFGSPSSDGQILPESRPQNVSIMAIVEPGETHSKDLFSPAQNKTCFSATVQNIMPLIA